ncbi:Dual serine/threonine and tyrosine protein kinase-like protein [Dinothrombium tinctorium]|uniref:Dual serine/threonine and tyrosine protein kinase n=1 Tax=Dinothrombium tinctorium TaxID=1965070 RepID=A0A3S3PT07_9ACAR|nr:Dual serine/threonine and tyrosine protein kinase-like protein [Dinothrombium tinctorium]
MAVNLPFEFTKFAKNRRFLKKILNNTQNAFHDIAKSNYFSEEQLADISLKSEEEEKLRKIIDNPVGIIVLGSKSWAKATIVNELLGYALLPVAAPSVDDNQSAKNWRTVRFMYGPQTQVSLAVANCYELVEHLAVYDRVWHQIPQSDLELREPKEADDPGYYSATLEIKLPHQLLDDDVQIILAPSTSPHLSFESIYNSCFEGVTPIVLYALSDGESLSLQEVDELMELKRLAPKTTIFFVKAQRTSLLLHDVSSASELTESQQHLLLNKYQCEALLSHAQSSSSPTSSCHSPSTPLSHSPPTIDSTVPLNSLLTKHKSLSLQCSRPPSTATFFHQLCSLGFLSSQQKPNAINQAHSSLFSPRKLKHKAYTNHHHSEMQSVLVEDFEHFPQIVPFARRTLQTYLVEASTMLHSLHNRCLRMFILTAFDMTRDMMITPKRIEYAKQKEQQLFDSLMAIANKKQDELRTLILETMESMRNDLVEDASKYKFKFNPSLNVDVDAENSLLPPLPALLPPTSSELRSPSRTSISSRSSSSSVSSGSESLKISNRDVQLATCEIQDYVLSRLNSAIAGKLIGSVDYLRDSYIGTLERCLLSLEKTGQEIGESVQASNALKQILNAAYQVEINMKTTSSFLRAFWEKMKQLVSSSLSWRNPPIIDGEWKRKVANDVLSSLSEWRLAKSICSQFKERLRLSHEQFASAMKQLENIHFGRLEKTEEQRIRVRKYYAPRIARFALESTSLRDVILYGMPQLGREIGRGQYGVVYACDSWAGHSPVAVKSVVPPDDKHWNDLAMEFYYTRSIPEHERLVQIRGSVIDHSYGGGCTPAVLLIMDRMSRDLYSAIKNGLDWLSRLQVAIDVVQGIRFLHSQGLVHRDIKLKNVLLDKRNRAKITDLGFCKPEAMMSGSIVGTPIHMAPELFSGKYDNTVDVYAFGILFWYICAGHVRLPYIFEQCQNKDQLWSCVRKGARPERLPQFDDECWTIMEQCWAGDPSLRPLLGDIEPKLSAISAKPFATKPYLSPAAATAAAIK